MAAHGAPEYSTADGNDYPAHEATYEGFLLLTTVSIAYLLNVCLALAIGGVKHAWFTAIGILVVATIVALVGFAIRSATLGYVLVVLSLLTLAVV